MALLVVILPLVVAVTKMDIGKCCIGLSHLIGLTRKSGDSDEDCGREHGCQSGYGSCSPVRYSSTLRTTYLPGPSSSATAPEGASYGYDPQSSAAMNGPHAPSSRGPTLASSYAHSHALSSGLAVPSHPTSDVLGQSSQAGGLYTVFHILATVSHSLATVSEATGPVSSSSAIPVHPSSSSLFASQSISQGTGPTATSSVKTLSSTLTSMADITSSHVSPDARD